MVLALFRQASSATKQAREWKKTCNNQQMNFGVTVDQNSTTQHNNQLKEEGVIWAGFGVFGDMFGRYFCSVSAVEKCMVFVWK